MTARYLAGVFSVVVVLNVPCGTYATVLFQDTFDRDATNDIDAGTTGMGGIAAPITYYEYDSIIQNEDITIITNHALNLSASPSASTLGLQSHNFIDSEILSNGCFSVSLNIANNGAKIGDNRWCGFGVGVSSNELAHLGIDLDGNTGPRGKFERGDTGGVADFYVDWSPNPDGIGSVQFFTNGTAAGIQIDLDGLDGAEGETIRADFFPADFNAGSSVGANVYFNDAMIANTRFFWNNTNENHIALSARQNRNGMIADDLLVETIARNSPNVIVILFDDLGWSDLGCYGGEIETPVVDALAENGLRFRNFYQAARCSPSRLSINTGLYTQQVASNPAAPLPNLRTDNNVTIAELLKANGYRTYMAGKWHLGKGDNKLPLARGFDHAYSKNYQADYSGANDFFRFWRDDFFQLDSTGGEISLRSYTNQFHYSDAIGDYSVDFINHNVAQNDGKPFFLYMTFGPPHFPLNGLAELANKYTDVADPAPEDEDVCLYEEGWDVVREKKYARQLDLGVIDGRFANTPKGDGPGKPLGYAIPDWNVLSTVQQQDLARRMAIYAAMIDQVDSNIGKVIARLEELGEMDNTFIFIVSDNGSNGECGIFGNGDSPDSGAWDPADLPAMGQPYSVFDELDISYDKYDRVNLGGGWANVANMPYRLFKRFTHNGGIRTPAIMYYPKGMDDGVKGTWSDGIGHLIDVMATVVDVTGVTYPVAFNGHTVLPVEGSSLMPAARGKPIPERDIAVEHLTNRAFFRGKWKFVTKNFGFSDGRSPAHQAELYNLEEDPCEMNNLASVETEKLYEMVEAWTAWLLRVYDVPDVDQLPPPAKTGLGPSIHLGYEIVVDSNRAIATGSQDLFIDTFARADGADADASYLGMGGSEFSNLGASNTYYEGYNNSNIWIVGAQLQMASAGNGLMHNFVGQDILEAGGFSVSLAVSDVDNAVSAGFGVGLSLTEASSAVSGMAIAADGFVELDALGNLSLYNNGALLGSVDVGSRTGTVSAAFSFDSFAATGSVDATLFFNGVAVLSGLSFAWDETDNNHIGLATVASGRVDLDNLAIRKLPMASSLAGQHALDAGLHGDDTDPERDTDGDGLDQFAEWIWGGDPNVAEDGNFAVVLTEASAANGFNFTYRRLKNAALYDVTYTVYMAADLAGGAWAAMTVEETGTATVPGNENYETVSARIPATTSRTNDVLFVQVRAGATP